MIRVVFEPGIIQGRFIGEAEIAQVRLLLSVHGDWSRWRVSRHLARLWEWRSASGQIKDMAARTLLLKLEDRGLIVLPPRRKAPPIRRSRKPASEVDRPGELFPEQANAGVDVALRSDIPGPFPWPAPSLFSAQTVGDTLHDLISSKGWGMADDWRKRTNQVAPTVVGGSKKHGGPDLGPSWNGLLRFMMRGLEIGPYAKPP